MLKNFLEKMRARRESFKEMQDQDRMHTTLSERKMNSNERELNRFLEEERQKSIKEQLEMFRKRKAEEGRKTTILGGKNIFKGHKSILTNNHKLLSNTHNSFDLDGGMFFNGK